MDKERILKKLDDKINYLEENNIQLTELENYINGLCGAVGWNPICIIIPCHRVIGANNKITGYGGGIKNKIKLLVLEGVDVSRYE